MNRKFTYDSKNELSKIKEKFNCSKLTEIELKEKTEERCFYLEINDYYNNHKVKIYVDRHDFLLYKRIIWQDLKKEKLLKRCLIHKKNSKVFNRCKNDCSKCKDIKHGIFLSLDSLLDNTNFDIQADDFSDPYIQTLFFEAIDLLWSLIKTISTNDQYDKIKYYYKDGLTFEQIAKIYGISGKAVEKTIKRILKKLKSVITEDQRAFLFKYIYK